MNSRRRLFLAHRETLRPLMAFREGVHRLFDGGEKVVRRGRGQAEPYRLCGSKMRPDEGTQSDARLCGPLPLTAKRLHLVPGQSPAGGTGTHQDLGVPLQEFLACLLLRHHPSPFPARRMTAS